MLASLLLEAGKVDESCFFCVNVFRLLPEVPKPFLGRAETAFTTIRRAYAHDPDSVAETFRSLTGEEFPESLKGPRDYDESVGASVRRRLTLMSSSAMRKLSQPSVVNWACWKENETETPRL